MSMPLGERDYPLCEFLADLRDVRKLNTGRKYAFILGSGASVPSDIPTGEGLVSNWVKELYLRAHPKETPTGANDDAIQAWATAEHLGIPGFVYAQRAQFYGKVYQRRFHKDLALGQDYLRDVMRDKRPSFGYSVLAQLVARTPHRLVITTNFDHLLEEALKRYAQKEPLVCSHKDLANFIQNQHDGPVLAKIHGDIQFETYNADEDLAQLKTQWQNPLHSLLQNYIPIFIGYGGNDPGFMDFLYELPLNTFRHGVIWTHRPKHHPRNTQRIHQLVEKFNGRYVAIPGFDEFMFLLGDVFELKKLDTQMEAEATRRVDEYRQTVEKTLKALREARLLPGCAEFPAWVETSLERFLGTPVERSWRDWQSLAKQETNPAKQREIYETALKQLPDSPELLSHYAEFLASNPDGTDQCERVAAKAVALAEKQFGVEHPSTLLTLANQAEVLYYRGKYSEANPINARVLAVRERVLGPEHPDTLESVNNLAGSLQAKGDLAAAEPLYQRALESRERVLGPEHPDTLSSVNNLALLLKTKGDLAAAEPLYRRALQAFERVLGPEHPDTLSSVNNLASLLYAKGDLAAAEPLLRRVLTVRDRVLESEHPNTLTSVNNLAELLRVKGDLASAEPLHRRALTVRERVLGPEHPDTLGSVNNLALLLDAKGDLAGALPLFERAVQSALQKLGPDHPNTKLYQENLAPLRAELAEEGQ